MTDAPKWYLHEPFMLGANVPDGRQGRRVGNSQVWRSAEQCRDWPDHIHETRPVRERMVAIDLPESVVRKAAGWRPCTPDSAAVRDACRAAVEQLDGGS